MPTLGQDCDCQILYGVREVHFKRLHDDGSESAAWWYATDCPVEIGLDPEIEEGATNHLRCGDVIKNTMRGDDQLTGMTVRFTMGCRNPEIEYIIAGSVGTITYDASSPPCAIGYTAPTLEEQENAIPFEMRIYRSEKDGSNDVGFEEIHLYQCLPSFVSTSGSQEEYSTQEWTIACVENPSYDADGEPVFSWQIVASIPS
jgi:hypothetical protein